MTNDIRSAAATLGRKGGQSKSAAKSAAVRDNGRLGGSVDCLGSIRLDTARQGPVRGRILWHRSTGQIRVAEPGQSWPTAQATEMPSYATRAAAVDAAKERWSDPSCDLALRSTTTWRSEPLASTLHRDGSITYWSVYQQRWIRTADISDDTLATFGSAERDAVIRHMTRAR